MRTHSTGPQMAHPLSSVVTKRRFAGVCSSQPTYRQAAQFLQRLAIPHAGPRRLEEKDHTEQKCKHSHKGLTYGNHDEIGFGYEDQKEAPPQATRKRSTTPQKSAQWW